MTRDDWRRPALILLAGTYAFGALRFSRRFPSLEFNFADTIFALATLGIVLMLIAEVIARVTRQEARRPQFRLAVVTIVLVLAGTEAGLKFGWGLYTSAQEQNEGHYRTRYLSIVQMKGDDARWQRYFVYPSHLDQIVTFSEFTYHRKTNALGLRGPEIDPRPAAGVFRIFSIGDSFTEGFGVSEEESWPRQLGPLLASRAPDRRVESINAGVAGSDPVFASTLLEEVLAPMHPDLVIQAVSANDAWDICDRGGFERYRPDGSVVLKPGPSWEWLYALSYIARHVTHDFLGFDGLLKRPEARDICAASARAVVRDAISRSCRVAEKAGFSLAVVIHPMPHEIQTGRHELDHLWEGDPPACANVLWLRDWFTTHGVRADNVDDFYWPLDRHHTARGNRVFAEGVADHIVKAGLFPGTKAAS